MIHKAKSPQQRDMPGADQTLPTVRFTFDSGNYCDVTVAKKSIGDGECRVSVEWAWRNNPSAREEAEAEAEIASMGLNPRDREFLVSSSHGENSRRDIERWLNQGEKPR